MAFSIRRTTSPFLPVAAEVYARHTSVEKGPGTNTRQARLTRAERWLREFARWFDRRARPVFIAMSFQEDVTLRSVGQAIDEAIEQFNRDHPSAPLAPVRVDRQGGASYEIPARVFQDIDESRLVIADLTDERPNVYCEVGYAKSRGIPFILTFNKRPAGAGPPWDRTDAGGNKVHFDLAAFRRISYDNPLHLRDQLKAELDALFEASEVA